MPTSSGGFPPSIIYNMLSNFEIEDICRNMGLDCVGVYSKDRLPKYKTYGGYYVNLQNYEDGNGTHFTFFFLDSHPGRPASSIYFDSFGMPPPLEVENFMGKDIMYNTRDIQDLQSKRCGWFCIALHYFLTYDQDSNKSLLDNYADFLSTWSFKSKTNDNILMEYLRGKSLIS
jgi:hypothetical protein